jgi:beta-phosphoglucomutase-like phosphatase (HAD superfamily)
MFGSRLPGIALYGTDVVARIALDIDSTLHHYWDLLDSIARERFGVELPYHEQRGWGITRLERADLIAAIEETHSEENIVNAEPYPGAVEVVSGWHRAGHWIHVTSHGSVTTRVATERWLERIGMPYDDLHCSYDKVSRCIEVEIDVLVDDSPVNLAAASEAGIVAATILHPWNEELVRHGAAIGGRDWPELAERLEPVLAGSTTDH